MFNWDANSGQNLASSYVWVYFVVAIPLTVLVVGIWWYWQRRQQKNIKLLSDQMEFSL